MDTDDGRRLPYDRLVYALGSRTADVGERAFTVESAAGLHKRLLDGPGELAVVGGGLTGIELAAELAESHRDWRVRLLSTGEVGGGLSPGGRAHVRTVLTALGVRIEEGHRVADPADVDADTVVWAASMTANTQLAEDAGLALDPAGRILVDADLRSVSRPGIYPVGDAAAITSPLAGPLRMACATALPTASHAASAIIAEARGRQPKPLAFRYVLQCVSLGRGTGWSSSCARTTPRAIWSCGVPPPPASRSRWCARPSASCGWPPAPGRRRPPPGHALMGDQNG
ncbi:NAD(P)/FAD-dependent oxidoreductase [Streptomyces sp. BRA346]|uniref:NAD(P)/FAD-dependent oxidoreductase n=1 Tax=Streptomyces sp. BRA346 TaxID=2878199 RepID=UPI0040631E1A